MNKFHQHLCMFTPVRLKAHLRLGETVGLSQLSQPSQRISIEDNQPNCVLDFFDTRSSLWKADKLSHQLDNTPNNVKNQCQLHKGQLHRVLLNVIPATHVVVLGSALKWIIHRYPGIPDTSFDKVNHRRSQLIKISIDFTSKTCCKLYIDNVEYNMPISNNK